MWPGHAASAGTIVGIGLKDADNDEAIKLLDNTYLPGGIPNGTFGEAKIPITDFTTANPAVGTTKIIAFEVWYQRPDFATTITTSSLYFDNIPFRGHQHAHGADRFLANGSAIANGTVFTTTSALEVTALGGGGYGTTLLKNPC